MTAPAPSASSGRAVRVALELRHSHAWGLSGYSDQSLSGRLLDEARGRRSPAESALAGTASKAPQASKMRWTS